MPTATQLKKAIQIAEQIQSLQAELEAVLGSEGGSSSAAAPAATAAAPKKRRKRSKMSAEGRARIAAAQKLRWAKARAGK